MFGPEHLQQYHMPKSHQLHQLIENFTQWALSIIFISQTIIAGFSWYFLLNQARAGLPPTLACFLEIAFVREVGVCVCVSAPRGYKLHSRDI